MTFQPPVPTVRALKNGLAVWIVEQHQVPLATVELVVRAGEDTDPSGKPGTASFVGDMLDEGTTLHDAPAIATAFEDQAALFRTQADKDSLIAAVSFPSASLSPSWTSSATACSTLAFKKPDLERVRALRLGDLAQLEADPAQIGKTVLNRTVFGKGHPWAFPTTGTVASTKAARGDQLAAWHRSWVRPNNAVLVVVGDVNPAARSARARAPVRRVEAGGAPEASLARARLPEGSPRGDGGGPPGRGPEPALGGRARPRRGQRGSVRRPGCIHVLGGGFKSRLNANLRSGKGYTYGAFSAFDVRREPACSPRSPRWWRRRRPRPSTSCWARIDRLREGGIDATELADAKSGLIQSLPAEFGSTTSTALAFGKVVALGRPPEYFASYVQSSRQSPARTWPAQPGPASTRRRRIRRADRTAVPPVHPTRTTATLEQQLLPERVTTWLSTLDRILGNPRYRLCSRGDSHASSLALCRNTDRAGVDAAAGAGTRTRTEEVPDGAESINKKFEDPGSMSRDSVSSDSRPESREVYAKREEILARSVVQDRQRSVADIGAGTGLYTFPFAEKVGPKGTGLCGRHLAGISEVSR